MYIYIQLVNGNVRKLFRGQEKKSIKLIETKSHRAFNECCLNIYKAYCQSVSHKVNLLNKNLVLYLIFS